MSHTSGQLLQAAQANHQLQSHLARPRENPYAGERHNVPGNVCGSAGPVRHQWVPQGHLDARACIKLLEVVRQLGIECLRAVGDGRLGHGTEEDSKHSAVQRILQEMEERAHDAELRTAREHHRQAPRPATSEPALEGRGVELPSRALGVLARQRNGIPERRQEKDAERPTEGSSQHQRRLRKLHLDGSSRAAPRAEAPGAAAPRPAIRAK
mmetsp:Transcript_6136/g.16676  ORF Transcript_6136/g.16676 Transcript_6136/m.16676 type:complete len:211 (+) Transcript_6136:536-1168(+)